jgi:hypothetical protein
LKLSDITVKFWVYDTSATDLAPQVFTGGCLTNANGNPSCFHQVSGVAASATAFSPACGPDPNHQANWEVTISNTDGTLLGPGEIWTNLQAQLHLASYAAFSPGTSQWYSPCLSGPGYANDGHFAVYYREQLVFSSGLTAPSCRSPHGQQQLQGHITSAIANAPLVRPVPQSTRVHLAIGLPVRNEQQLRSEAQQVSDPNSPKYRQYLASEQMIAAYSPTQSDYEALIGWAQSSGFRCSRRTPIGWCST